MRSSHLIKELFLSVVVLMIAALSLIIFPLAQAGYSNMSVLAKFLLLPSLIILIVALLIGKAWGKSNFLRNVRVGIISGIIATIALEIVRETGFQLGYMPGSLPKLMGVLITDSFMEGPSIYSDLAGWGYHFWNGASLGIIYTILFGSFARWWLGIVYGTIIGFVFMLSPAVTTLGIGYFGLKFSLGFPIVVTLAHISFGAVLGVLVYRWYSEQNQHESSTVISFISTYRTSRVTK